MGAGCAGSTVRYKGVNVNQIQFGDKLQGLPPLTGTRRPHRIYKRKAGGQKPGRDTIFCVNQLGGMMVKNSQFAANADGVKECSNRKNHRHHGHHMTNHPSQGQAHTAISRAVTTDALGLFASSLNMGGSGPTQLGDICSQCKNPSHAKDGDTQEGREGSPGVCSANPDTLIYKRPLSQFAPDETIYCRICGSRGGNGLSIGRWVDDGTRFGNPLWKCKTGIDPSFNFYAEEPYAEDGLLGSDDAGDAGDAGDVAASWPGALQVDGYYPLYLTEAEAQQAAVDKGGSGSHLHTIDNKLYYMPGHSPQDFPGLLYHGDYTETYRVSHGGLVIKQWTDNNVRCLECVDQDCPAGKVGGKVTQTDGIKKAYCFSCDDGKGTFEDVNEDGIDALKCIAESGGSDSGDGQPSLS
jgi:hypothetical protein